MVPCLNERRLSGTAFIETVVIDFRWQGPSAFATSANRVWWAAGLAI